MNDRYLYRAKRIDNGEWVEGFLIFEKDRAFIAHRVCEVMNSYSKTGEEYGFGNFIEVYTSTICQCTGLNDLLSRHGDKSATDFADAMLHDLNVVVEVTGEENIPTDRASTRLSERTRNVSSTSSTR